MTYSPSSLYALFFPLDRYCIIFPVMIIIIVTLVVYKCVHHADKSLFLTDQV